VEGNSLVVAKPIDDRDGDVIVSARAVTDVNDHTVQLFEITSNFVQSGG
jgi:hypothetical protein